MAICSAGEKLLQEATGIRREPVYSVAKNQKIIIYKGHSVMKLVQGNK